MPVGAARSLRLRPPEVPMSRSVLLSLVALLVAGCDDPCSSEEDHSVEVGTGELWAQVRSGGRPATRSPTPPSMETSATGNRSELRRYCLLRTRSCTAENSPRLAG